MVTTILSDRGHRFKMCETYDTSSPGVKLSATLLTFSTQAAGTSSAAQTVTLTNSGTASLTFTASMALTGGQADDYSFTTTCGASLSAGARCTLSVTFKPVSASKKLASIKIYDNAAGSPQSVVLIGTGS